MKKSIFLFFAAILCSMSIDAYAATQRYIYVGLSNNYHQWKNASQWGINHWGGTGAGVVPGSKITDLKTTITHSNCTFHMYRMYVYDDNKNFEFKGSDSWWDCKKEGKSISGTTNNALLFRDNDGGDGGSPTFYQTNYQEESAASLSASSNSVSIGEEVTLTPKLTSNAEYNEIASTTYSVGTGATVSDGKFVATTAGTYTVTATITYNPKKFTGITKKVENVTCEIVVSEVAVPHPVTGVTVAPTSVTIKQGATVTLTATVAPSNADDPSVTWSSDNNSVATVVNGVVTAVAAGTANITVTTVDGGFTATCAVKVKPLQYTFYAINSAEWPTVAAHYWEGADGGSAWPGANMVKESETINGFDIYSITISSDFVNIMFTNQIDGDKNKKTADLTTEGNDGKYYDIKEEKWYASLSEVPVSYDYYVIGTVNSWALKDADFGMADDNADGVYEKVVTLDDGKNQMKINNGTWDNASTFGYDQLDAKYEGVSRGKDGDDNNIIIDITTGKDITVKFDKNANKITLDGLTKIEDYYTVVGVAELFGEAWATANESNKMVKQGDGSYKLVKENVTLAAIGYDWKIAKNGNWWDDAATGVNPAAGKNNTLTITTAGRYNVTFTLTADLKTAKAETELLEAAVVIPDCFISGNKNLTGKETEWQGNEFTMVYDEENETWSYTLAGLQPEKAYELKVVCGGTWYSYADLASVPTGVTEGNDHSIAFKMAAAGDVVVTYKVEAGITLSGNFAIPVTYDYYIAGTLAGGWSATQQGMEKDGELYKATFTELNAGTYQFKITDGQFNTEEDKTHEHTTLGAEYEEVSYNDGNIKIVTEEAINLTVFFNAATDKITFEGLTEIIPTYTVAGDSEAAFGTTWDPTNTANDMALEGDLYKWTKTNVALRANTKISFKVVKNHDWNKGQWPERDGENDNNWILQDDITADGLYTITITFKEDDKTINATATKTGDIVIKDFSNQPATLYFHPSFHWTSDAAQFAAYFYNDGPGADATPTWVNMTDGDGDCIYEVVNAKQHEYVIICRMNPSRAENNWEDEVMWNQIEHGITIPNTAGDLNTCLAFWTNCQGDVPTSECTWVAPTPLTDKNWDAFIAAYNGKTINAVVERSFNSGQNHTLCLPFNLPTSWLGEGSKAYQLNSIFANTAEELQLNASECNTIEAGKPYIIVPVKGSEYEHIIVSGVTVEDVDAGTNVATGDGYKATLKAVTTTGGQTNGSTEYYVGADDGYLYKAVVDKLGLRAIIELTTIEGQALPANVRARIAQSDDTTTGFENITTTDKAVKVIENGQLIIIRDGVKYNAQGIKF